MYKQVGTLSLNYSQTLLVYVFNVIFVRNIATKTMTQLRCGRIQYIGFALNA